MKAKFTGVPGESHDTLSMYGQDFPRGEWVTVKSALGKVKLSKHPHFEWREDPADQAEDAVVKTEFTQLLAPALKQAEAEHIEPTTQEPNHGNSNGPGDQGDAKDASAGSGRNTRRGRPAKSR